MWVIFLNSTAWARYAFCSLISLKCWQAKNVCLRSVKKNEVIFKDSSVVFGRHSMMKYLCCAFDCMVAFKRQIIFALVGHLYCLESSTVKQKHFSFIQVKVQYFTIYTLYSGINWPQELCFFSPVRYKTLGSYLRGRFSLQVDIGLGFLF